VADFELALETRCNGAQGESDLKRKFKDGQNDTESPSPRA